MALIPPSASVAADTPLLPLLAQRDTVIRFPKHIHYRDRSGDQQTVEWIAAFPGFYTPLAPVFKRERKQQNSIQDELKQLTESDRYRLVHCASGAVVLQRQDPGTVSAQTSTHGTSKSCPWLD